MMPKQETLRKVVHHMIKRGGPICVIDATPRLQYESVNKRERHVESNVIMIRSNVLK
jgi:hypothetical protein